MKTLGAEVSLEIDARDGHVTLRIDEEGRPPQLFGMHPTTAHLVARSIRRFAGHAEAQWRMETPRWWRRWRIRRRPAEPTPPAAG